MLFGGGVDGVALDGDDEVGEVAVADDASELLLGDEHPGGGPALAHVAVLPALHVALCVTDDLAFGAPVDLGVNVIAGGR